MEREFYKLVIRALILILRHLHYMRPRIGTGQEQWECDANKFIDECNKPISYGLDVTKIS